MSETSKKGEKNLIVPILQTKLHPPVGRANLVSRLRLINKLNDGIGGKLTLICAPAGFGKTTLLSDWIRSTKRPAAWLALEASDSDIAQFLNYVVAALQQVEQDIGSDVQAALARPQIPPPDALLTRLINEIAAIEKELVLILDDYHVIEDPSIHEALAFLISHLPSNMHLIIAGRIDPPIPIARLRAQGLMTEIRSSDLRFTDKETKGFLNDLMDLGLSDTDIAALEGRIEGWIAGLQLAAFSLESSHEKHAFVTAFSGSHRHVMDYLVDEVLSHQPEEMQTFLHRTSIIGRLCAPLCNFVLGISNSQEFLQQLETNNLFLMPLDNERIWYRYHQLFAESLRQRLEEKESESVAGLHRRAAAWYRKEGFVDEAMSHAVAAQDLELATAIVEEVAVRLLTESKLSTILDLAGQLPDELVAAHPLIGAPLAWALLLSGHFERVELLLDAAESRLAEDTKEDLSDDSSVLGLVKGCRSFWELGQDNYGEAMRLAEEALEFIHEENLMARSALSLSMGFSHLWLGNVSQSISFLEEAYEASKKSDNYYVALTAIALLADLQAKKGHLEEASTIFRNAVQLGDEWSHGWPIPATGYSYVGLGRVLYEWNLLEEAAVQIEKSIELGEQAGESGIIHQGYLALMRLRKAQDNIPAALGLLERVERYAEKTHGPREEPAVLSLKAWFWLASDNPDEAIRWASDREKGFENRMVYLDTFENLTLVRALAAGGNLSRALALLDALQSYAEKEGLKGYLIEILVLRSLVLQRQGDVAQAIAQLEIALALAEPEGYIRTFLDEGEPMVALLGKVASHGESPAYAKKLLQAAKGHAARPSSGVAGPTQLLVEPLTERELDVLRLINEGLKYQEIASRLFVSLNTVRTHTKNIYRKLDVNGRMEAVNKAKELDLL